VPAGGQLERAIADVVVAHPELFDGHAPDLRQCQGRSCGEGSEGREHHDGYPTILPIILADEACDDDAARCQEQRGYREEDGEQVDPELPTRRGRGDLRVGDVVPALDLGDGSLGARYLRAVPRRGIHAPRGGVGVADSEVLRDTHILDQVRATGGIVEGREHGCVSRPPACGIDPRPRQAANGTQDCDGAEAPSQHRAPCAIRTGATPLAPIVSSDVRHVSIS
jgi:hypothetical protein